MPTFHHYTSAPCLPCTITPVLHAYLSPFLWYAIRHLEPHPLPAKFHHTNSMERILQFRSYSRISHQFVEHKCSFLCSEEPPSGSYPESGQSNPYHTSPNHSGPHHPILLSKTYFNIIHPLTSWSSPTDDIKLITFHLRLNLPPAMIYGNNKS
jgi:hypothetical protein